MTGPHALLTSDHRRWRETFEEEASKLRAALGPDLRAVEHIGSSAIEGLVSKPIVDIAVLIEHKADAESLLPLIASLGYAFASSSSERHFFTKEGDPYIHLSLAYADFSRYFERQILFRDQLRSDAGLRDEYGKLKRELLAKEPSGETTFIGKTDFVAKVLEAAGFDTSVDW